MRSSSRRERERLHSLIWNVPTGIYRATPEGRILLANPALVHMLGFDSLAELAQRNLETDGQPVGCERADFRSRLEAEGEILGWECAWQRRDGSLVQVRESARVIREGGCGSRVLYYEGMVEDVTAQKRSAEEAVRTSEARLRAIVNNMPVVVFGLDPNGVFTFLEGKGLHALGLQAGEYVGQSAFDVHRGDPALQEHLRRSLRGREYAWAVEYRGISYEIQCTPLKDENGVSQGVIGVAMDVTERQQLRAHVLQKEKLATVGELAAGIAHEVNNPLAAISGYAQLLAQHPDSLVREDADGIRAMAERASRVVRSLLTFARTRPNANQQDYTDCSLPDLVEEALALCAPTLRQAGIDVETHYADGGVPTQVRVNSTQIVQVLLNLLGNAEHALRLVPQGRRCIRIESAQEDTVVLLRVRDTGTGMSEEVRRRIFEPFFTTKDVGEGTGLGLAISHGIIESHRGEIVVDSEIDAGTTFTLRLPALNATTNPPDHGS